MTLSKAIEINTDCTQGALLGISPDTKGALKLGIEALKRLLDERTCSSQWPLRPLPGETED